MALGLVIETSSIGFQAGGARSLAEGVLEFMMV